MIIRPAEPKDRLAVARVHVRSWQVAYRGLLSDQYLDHLRPEDRAAKYDFGSGDPMKPQTILATKGDEVVGFATVSYSRDADLPNHGELSALYVDPLLWGRGYGVALMNAARMQMSRMGLQKALLWLLVGNERAARFYEMDRWTPDSTRRMSEVWGLEVDEVRYTTLIQS